MLAANWAELGSAGELLAGSWVGAGRASGGPSEVIVWSAWLIDWRSTSGTQSSRFGATANPGSQKHRSALTFELGQPGRKLSLGSASRQVEFGVAKRQSERSKQESPSPGDASGFGRTS